LHEEQTVELLFGFDKVWNAARTVFEQARWGIKKADKATGHYEVVVNTTLGEFGMSFPSVEKFRVDMTRIDENSTRVHAAIRFDQWHWGTTAWYVNTFFAELEKQLDSER
jgi:hypothetical protein